MTVEKVRPCGCIVQGIGNEVPPRGWKVVAPCNEHKGQQEKTNKRITQLQIHICHLSMYIQEAEKRGFEEMLASLKPELEKMEKQMQEMLNEKTD